MAAPTIGARKVLYVLFGVIAVGGVILGIDRLFVRGDEPPRSEQLAVASEALGMHLEDPYSDEGALRQTLKRFAVAPPPTRIGAAMVRRDDRHTLTAYEHGYRDTAVVTDHARHELDGTLLGILVRVSGAAFPTFELDAEGRVQGEVHAVAEAAVSRMASMPDFLFAAAGDTLFMVQRPPSSALVAAIQRDQNPNFLPGLLNSGLKIDLQRALDVAGLLLGEGASLPPVYRPNVDVKVEVAVPKLDLKLDASVSDFHRKLDALRQEQRAQREKLRQEHAQRRADQRQAFAERMKRYRRDSGTAPGPSEAPASAVQKPSVQAPAGLQD